MALTFLALGVNIVVYTPTFNQYGLVNYVSYLFGGFAAIQLYGLATKRLPFLRLGQAACVFVATAWAGALTLFTFTTGKTSLALPICFYSLAVLQLLQLIEPATNPQNVRKRKSA